MRHSRKRQLFKCLGVVALASGLAAAVTSAAAAHVSLLNGDFFISSLDLSYAGQRGLRLERVYNSKAGFRGLFGWGWGSNYETYLTIMGDGSAVVHEYAGGATNVFSPPQLTAGELEDTVQEIARAAGVANSTIGGLGGSAYVDRLRTDPDFRSTEWARLVAAKFLAPRQLTVGTILRSTRFGSESLERTAVGYSRRTGSGTLEEFDVDGRLIRVTEPSSGTTVQLSYAAQGGLSRLSDDFGHVANVTLNARGLMAILRTQDGRVAYYEYNNRDELVYSSDIDGTVRAYQYDTFGRHNVTGIAGSDGENTAITYYTIAGNENVETIGQSDGDLTRYDYGSEKWGASGRKETIKVSVQHSGEHSVAVSTHIYYLLETASGAETTARTVQADGAEVIDTSYSDRCNGAVTRTQVGQGVGQFAYDGECRLILKDTPLEVAHLSYTGDADRPSHVQLCEKGSSRCWSQRFVYDDVGNLVEADVTAPGAAQPAVTKISHDASTRVSSITAGGTTVNIAYNSGSLPSRLTVPGVGSVAISYDANGNVQGMSGGTDGSNPAILERVITTYRTLIAAVASVNVGATLSSDLPAP